MGEEKLCEEARTSVPWLVLEVSPEGLFARVCLMRNLI